jgi:hypothetical protein
MIEFKKPIMKITDTTEAADGSWLTSGTVTFGISQDRGGDLASLTFPFEGARDRREAIRQGAQQLQTAAKVFAQHAPALAGQ